MRRNVVHSEGKKTVSLRRRVALIFISGVLVFSSFQFGLAEIITDWFDKSKKQMSMDWLQRIDSGSQQRGEYAQDDSSGVPLDRFELRTGIAKKDYRPHKEIVDQCTANTKTFINKDGSRTLRYSMRQLHYQDGRGRFRNIENAFKKKPVTPILSGFDDAGAHFFATQAESSGLIPATLARAQEAVVGDAGAITMEAGAFGDGITFRVNGKEFTLKPQGGPSSSA